MLRASYFVEGETDPLILPAEIKVGRNWYDMKDIGPEELYDNI